jgi:putative phosphoribosyl transferase
MPIEPGQGSARRGAAGAGWSGVERAQSLPAAEFQDGDRWIAMDGVVRSGQVRIGRLALPGDLGLPAVPRSLVLFAHGSGSSRFSERNRWVATVLQRHGQATLLFDLLREDEGFDRRKVFDIDLLSGRVVQALDWAAGEPSLAALRCGLFGASTGAAAALCAAAARPGRVGAVVSRGGRPDLATVCLPQVAAPTLLVVGAADREVLELNRRAMRELRCNKRLEVVPGAGHLFEEPGALGSVAELAASWFDTHLGHGQHV